MSQSVKVAAVQMDIRLGDKEHNLAQMEQRLAIVAGEGARLAVFPECALAGYCFDSLDDARPFAEPVPGPAVERIAAACKQHQMYAVFGLLEAAGDKIYNACALVGPEGLIGNYRKTHLPFLGIDRFTTPGQQPYEVFDAGPIRVGMNICYDGAFPEPSRVMALRGADLIVLPTNWPPGAETTAEHVINARALENNVYYLAADRVGEERGFRFIGMSKICDPNGRELCSAGDEEAILYAELDPERARSKRIVRVPDKHIIDRFVDRRPELYRPLVGE